ncbi:MAG: plasmid stabilization protein [Proteobacteria bacterium]|nr:plasmid stabilization protein [Pseudomonadota bacterium]
MATMTIRNLDDALKARLRMRAARHGQSMEEEARSILRAALAQRVEDESAATLYTAIRARMEPLGGVELALPPRPAMREPPDFGD